MRVPRESVEESHVLESEMADTESGHDHVRL
jgi:hypothetical protein